MNKASTPLLRALREPRAMAGFEDETWDLVVRQAFAAGLLGRLGALAIEAGIQPRIPAAVWRHVQAVLTIAQQQQRAVQWELVQLTRTLADLPGPVVLLKGAAYAAAGLPPATGRLFSDIDLLVPKGQLDAAEAALMLGGWNSAHHDPYDQRYYRQWMHELPPMRHIRRQTVLDLHHDILPETARLRTNSAAIIAESRPLRAHPRFSIPCPSDLVLHSATHLFHEGEWQHGLRDLADIDALLRAYGQDARFWESLLLRASELGLGRPLFYALRYCQRLLETPLPETVLLKCPASPTAWCARAMDRLFVPAFGTAHTSCRTAASGVAAFGLYVRSHWLRMPATLLLPHLARKFWLDHRPEWARDEPAAG